MNKFLTALFSTKETVKVHSIDTDGNVMTTKRETVTLFGNKISVKHTLIQE